MRRVAFLVIMMIILSIVASGCITGGHDESPRTTTSSFEPTSSTTSSAPLTSSSPSHTTTSPIKATTSSTTVPTTSSPSPPSEVEEILGSISSYLAEINTSVDSVASVQAGSFLRNESVSVFSNASAFFDVADGEMEVNMSVFTYPAGGKATVRIVLIEDEAWVNSLGTWKHVGRSDEGFDALSNLLKFNPVSLVLHALDMGLCNVSGSGGNFEVRCSGVRDDLLGIIGSTVGAPEGSRVSVFEPRISVKIVGGRVVSGELEVGFELSHASQDGSWVMSQRGVVKERFRILEVNRDLDLSPPSS